MTWTLLDRLLAALPGDLASPAVRSPGATVTYARLLGAAARRAGRLEDLGVATGGRVALILPRGADAAAYAIAAMIRGAAYAHLDPTDPPSRIRTLLEAFRPDVVVQPPDPAAHGARAEDSPAPDDWDRDCAVADVQRRRAVPGRVAYLVHTSGTTGTPKVVQVPHEAAVNVLAAIDACAPCPEPVVSSLWTSPRFDVSVWETWAALVHGGTLVTVPDAARHDPAAFLDCLEALSVTSAFVPVAFVPALLSAVERSPARLPALRRILVGVEPIRWELLARIVRARPELAVVNGYGPAEATICCTLYRVTERCEPDVRCPIGTAIPGIDLLVLGAGGQPVEPGAPGELVVVGQSVADGYLDDAPAGGFHVRGSRRAYRTGDLVRARPDGNLVFVGRRDRQLKLRGHRLEPGEVETAVSAASAVREVIVDAVETARGTLLAAFVVLDGAAPLDEPAVRRSLASRLPAYAVPSVFVTLDSIPQTDAGKIDRVELGRLAAAAVDEGARPAAGSDPSLASRVSRAWRETVGGPLPGLSFVASGGMSMDALRLAARLGQETGRSISPAEILAAAGPDDVAGYLASAPAAAVEPPSSGRGPLSPGQLGIWLDEQATAEPRAYCETLCFRLPASADVDRLAASLDRALDRHPAFSAAIREGADGLPEQVLDARRPGIAVTAASSLESAIDGLRARVYVDGPLAEFEIVDCDPRGVFLLLAWHHLVVDDHSAGLFLDDLARCYADPGHLPERPRSTPCDLARAALELDAAPPARAAARDIAERLRPLLSGTGGVGVGQDGDVAGVFRMVLEQGVAGGLASSWRRAGLTPTATWAAALLAAVRARWPDVPPVVAVPRTRRSTAADLEIGGCGLDTALVAATAGSMRESAAEIAAWLRRWIDPAMPSLLAVIREMRRIDPRFAGFPELVVDVGRRPSLRLDGVRCEPVAVPANALKFPISLRVAELEDGGVEVWLVVRGQPDTVAAAVGRHLRRAIAGGFSEVGSKR